MVYLEFSHLVLSH